MAGYSPEGHIYMGLTLGANPDAMFAQKCPSNDLPWGLLVSYLGLIIKEAIL
jgi:hypothetical protein